MNDISTINKIMEYMALGKPIVQFDVTEERISAQEASLYTKANDPMDCGEKILDLIEDPPRRAFMAECGPVVVTTTDPDYQAGLAELRPWQILLDFANQKLSGAIAVEPKGFLW